MTGRLDNVHYLSHIIIGSKRKALALVDGRVKTNKTIGTEKGPMYLAGVSVRRVEDITEALWGTKVSPATVSEKRWREC